MPLSIPLDQLMTVHNLLVAAGIPIDGVDGNGLISFQASATPTQRTQGNAIVSGYDGLKLGKFNGTVTGAKLIGIVGAAGKIWLPMLATVGVFSAVGVTTPPTVSIGTNSPNYDNVVGATPLTGWTTGDMQNILLGTSARIKAVTGSLPVFANVSVAAAATQYILVADFLGRWLDV